MSAYADAPVPLTRPLAPYPLETYNPDGRVEPPFVLIEGSEKSGKAQPLHARIATPAGWTTMGAIEPGHRVIGTSGKATTVTAVYDRGERDIYRLTFSDGVAVEACDEHLWATWTSSSVHSRYNKGPKKGRPNPRPAVVRTTAELRELTLDGSTHLVAHIPVTEPVEYDDLCEPLPLNPYALGLLLGGGGLAEHRWPVFTPGDPELFDALALLLPDGDMLTRHCGGSSAGIRGGHTTAVLRETGLLGTASATKFIPPQYLRASVPDRLALLQGLMDTAGGLDSTSIRFISVSAQLAQQLRELVHSLGGTCTLTTKQSTFVDGHGERRDGTTAYLLTLRLPVGLCPFRLARKLARWKQLPSTLHTPPRRTVRSVEYVGTMPARCIAVAADDHLYLTDHFVVTHNTWSVAEATGDQRICHTWWIEINEKPCAREYGKIPGARYKIVRHDGTFWSILSLVEQISVQARDMLDHGRAPMIVIDTAAGVWEAVKALAQARTMASPSVQRKIANNPAARADNHPITQNTWNDVIDQWYRLIRLLQHFPGIAVVISRGKEVLAVDDDGKPIDGQRTYRVEGHKSLAYDASAWIRMSRDAEPVIISARSTRNPVRPGIDRPRPYRSLPDLLFRVLEYEPKPWEPDLAEQAHRQRVAGDPDPSPTDWGKAFTQANALDQPKARRDALVELWTQAKEAQRQSRSVPTGLIARIEHAGHQAAEKWRIEIMQAWDEAHAEQIRLDVEQNVQGNQADSGDTNNPKETTGNNAVRA